MLDHTYFASCADGNTPYIVNENAERGHPDFRTDFQTSSTMV